MNTLPLEIRFWEKVNKTNTCWLWTGAMNNKGYGTINIQHTPKYVHRVSWAMFNGALATSAKVLHRCDKPLCVNPAHLFLGSQLDNMKDCKNKDRCASKVSLQDADNIRQEYKIRKLIEAKVKLQEELASRYNVSSRTIRYITSEGRRVYG